MTLLFSPTAAEPEAGAYVCYAHTQSTNSSHTLGLKRPYVGASHARSWSPLLVLGAILWEFIAKT